MLENKTIEKTQNAILLTNIKLWLENHSIVILIILALFLTITIFFLLFKSFIPTTKIRTKNFLRYNEILFLRKKGETEKALFSVMDYLGFSISAEEYEFAFKTPQNSYLFLKYRKTAGNRKIKFEDGRYKEIKTSKAKLIPYVFFCIGSFLLSLYLSFSFNLFIQINNKALFGLLSTYILCISLPLMISSYVSIKETYAVERLTN